MTEIGMLRRRIDVSSRGKDCVVAWVEDDFHHFGVTLRHDGKYVTDISARAERAPWTTCAAAALPLRALIGKSLIARASDIGGLINMRLQCTHMFDLTGLALAHAWHGRDHRRYEVRVPDRAHGGATRATLLRDGETVMVWNLAGSTIVGPPAYAGHSLEEGFRAWTEAMAEEEAEQAFVLRRAIMVSGGRGADLDRFDTAADLRKPALCHTFQPDNAALGLRNKGSTRNYADETDMLGALDVVP
jgi:hypothetical protein